VNLPDEKSNTPFALQRPEITITPSEKPLFEVDWQELAWWFAVPEVRNHTLWAIYEPPDWRLGEYCHMRTVCPALVHGIDGVEIDAVDREFDGDRLIIHPWTFFARLTDSRVQYLASISSEENGTRKLYTLLDEGFDENWGESQRRVRHTGRFAQQVDGSYVQNVDRLCPGDDVEGMGVYEVTIGPRSFTCLRVLDVPQVFTEESILMEGFLTREGRTVLCRRYNGRLWLGPRPGTLPYDERYPTHNRIVIDGVTFVHWYDCLSDLACGIDADSFEDPLL
jgi:hypothetical protein